MRDNGREQIEQLIKDRGYCYDNICQSEPSPTQCPLTRVGCGIDFYSSFLMTPDEFFNQRYIKAIEYYLNHYGSKGEIVEILI